MNAPSPRLAYAMLSFTALLWAGNLIVGRAVHAEVPPIGLAFWRWLVGLLVVLPFASRHIMRDWPVIRRHWRFIAIMAAVGIAAFNTLVYIGLHFTTAINALLLQSTMPVLIVLFSFFLFGERVAPIQGLGVLVSLAGVTMIVVRGDLAALRDLALNRGDAIVFAAVASYALYSTLLRKKPAMHPLSFVAAIFALGAVMLLPLYLWESLSGDPMRATVTTFAAVGYVAIFPSVVAYFCFNQGIAAVGANRGGIFFHLMPVFGSLLAMLFLDETMRPFHLAGFALILSGLYLATRAPRSV